MIEERAEVVHRDRRTERYFDKFTPSYSLRRYEPVVEFLCAESSAGASFLDVGCGSGNVLELIRKRTPVGKVAGMDVSRRFLEQCAANVDGCRTHAGSILDDSVVASVGCRYRYVMVGAVLHHLVGNSRRRSRALGRRALDNAWALVEPGGALIVMEPTFRPRWAMGVLFHVKQVIGRLTPRRVSLLGYWNNIGEPVVSYYSHAELVAEIHRLGGQTAIDSKKLGELPMLWRLAGIVERANSIVIVRKEEGLRADDSF